jgi:AcrR family transcriptional regulator
MSAKAIRSPVQKRSQEKRRRIFEAGKRLFAERGYAATTAKDIAAEAEVSIGTFYAYVEDKKALFLEVVQWYYKDIMERIMVPDLLVALQEAEGPSFCRMLVQMAVDAHTMSTIFHKDALAMVLTDADMAALVEKEDKKVLTAVTALLEANKERLRVDDLEAAAIVVLCAVEETVHAVLLFNSPVESQRLMKELADMLNRYLFKEDAAT